MLYHTFCISDIRYFVFFCCISHHALQVRIKFPELPIGLKFDPTDPELLHHLHERCNLTNVSNEVINEFIPTIEHPVGICYTHPENLPGTYGYYFLIDQCL
jgi:hypothetical protein